LFYFYFGIFICNCIPWNQKPGRSGQSWGKKKKNQKGKRELINRQELKLLRIYLEKLNTLKIKQNKEHTLRESELWSVGETWVFIFTF
jgi:hypothetical protein